MKNRLTKKEIRLLEAYNNSCYKSIDDVYKNYSAEKCRIEALILCDMQDCHGSNYKILSYNDQVFTCAYKYIRDNKEYLKVFSRSGSFSIDLSKA